MRAFLAHFLFVLAAWTVVIKYLFPIAYSQAYGEPILAHVYLDLWPIAHVAVGWSLLHWSRYTFALAAAASVAEIAIVVTKLVLFLSAPQWNIFSTNWFINKLFVLGCFILLLGYLIVHARAHAGARERGLAST
jgi:hypothetical protein